MNDVFATLFLQHNLILVLLAALICAASAFAGIALVDRARRTRQGLRAAMWISVAALAVGFGIWSTHFVAMLAYMPGIPLGYQPLGTLGSLLVAIVASGIGFAIAATGHKRSDHILGGIVIGLGITAMHYSGMQALRVGGAVGWDFGLVGISILSGAVLAGAAVMVGAQSASLRIRTGAAALLTLSIVCMHFIGMGAVDLSNCYAIVAGDSINSGWLATGVALGSAVILAAALMALFLDTKDITRSALESRRLHSLADAAAEGLVIVRDTWIEGANASFATLVGADQTKLIGATLGEFFDLDALAQARTHNGRFFQTIVTSVTGDTIDVELMVQQAELKTGRTEVLAVRDIRDRLAQQAAHMRITLAMQETEQRFGRLLQSVTDYAIYMLDTNGLVASWNAGAERNKGYTADEIIGQSFAKFFSAEDQAAGMPEKILETARQRGKVQKEGWRYRKDGTCFWAEVTIEAIRDDAGNLVSFIKITRDITRQHEDAKRIADAARNLKLSLTHMSQGLALFGVDERIVVANQRLHEILGIPTTVSIEGLGLHDLAKFFTNGQDLSPEEIDAIYDRHKRLIVGQDSGEVIQDFPGAKSIRIVHRPAGDGAWVSTFEDISERKRTEQQIAFMAHHDGLTGLPNRGSFSEHLKVALERARGENRVAVIGIDLDRFKEVNDQHGHQAGDLVLKHYANRIARGLQEGEFVARFGGDEFAAFKAFRSDNELYAFLKRLQFAVAERFSIDRSKVSIGASIGIAVYPDDAMTAEKLISNADMAMYRAKENLTERLCFYQSDMDEAARDRRLMARDLWEAVARNEFSLAYQVQKSVRTGLTTGYEALLRWRHPTRGNVSPADFIPVAEECGAILHIGEWVLQQACLEAAHWAGSTKLAVNISPVQLGSANLVEVVKSALETANLPPERLELEVTESAIISDKVRALHMLGQIKQLGVTIAIDDFGTGYSSLETLRSFPFDKIKLDRSFMAEVETSKQSKALVRAILELGRGLEVPVLAEGVETSEQLSFLVAEGCDEAQGYYLGRPAHMERELVRQTA